MPYSCCTVINRILFCYFIVLAAVQCYVNGQTNDYNIRAMTFNIWQSGNNVNNGLKKIIKHIEIVNPDIVALQEVYSEDILNIILEKLGKKWTGFCGMNEYPDQGIITQHQIIEETKAYDRAGIGADVYIKRLNMKVNFWSLHLCYKSYGPYAAFNKLVTSENQIMAGEYGRILHITDLLSNKQFKKAIGESGYKPVIVAGDFNSPSHLDWTSSTSSFHGGWAFDWPATKYLQTETGLQDSFRQLYPDVVKSPGITWSTVQKMSPNGWNWTIPEPQDRIDFIFYTNTTILASYSKTYSGYLPVIPLPNHKNNDYPSDHFAVITDFVAYKRRE